MSPAALAVLALIGLVGYLIAKGEISLSPQQQQAFSEQKETGPGTRPTRIDIPLGGDPAEVQAAREQLGIQVASEIGRSVGTDFEAALYGAGSGALIIGSPIGAVITAGVAFVESHANTMDEVHAFRELQFMLSNAEYSKWAEKKKKSESCPSIFDCPNLDASVHKNLHDYEVSLTNKYRTEAGVGEFYERIYAWYTRQLKLTNPSTVAWLDDQGVTLPQPIYEAGTEGSRVRKVIGYA